MQKHLCLFTLIFLASTSAGAFSIVDREMPIQPPVLKKQDKVAIVAPAFYAENPENIIR